MFLCLLHFDSHRPSAPPQVAFHSASLPPCRFLPGLFSISALPHPVLLFVKPLSSSPTPLPMIPSCFTLETQAFSGEVNVDYRDTCLDSISENELDYCSTVKTHPEAFCLLAAQMSGKAIFLLCPAQCRGNIDNSHKPMF